MPNMTLALPKELHEKMKRYPEMRWSEVARKSIEQRVETLEFMNRVAAKSKLTKKDVDDISRTIKREVYEEMDAHVRRH